LSRIINPESAGKERTHLAKSVVVTIRELMRQTEPDDETRDLAAYVALALQEMAATIEPSIEAWEKRGYWVKADHFRLDWEWCGKAAHQMRLAVLSENWAEVAQLAAQIAQRLGSFQVAKNHHLGKPWVGAWNKLVK
jgi:hypothetical protein